jgi:hypothetical protein
LPTVATFAAANPVIAAAARSNQERKRDTKKG